MTVVTYLTGFDNGVAFTVAVVSDDLSVNLMKLF